MRLHAENMGAHAVCGSRPPPSGPWNSSVLHFSVDRGAGRRPRRFEIGFDVLGKVSAVEGRPSAGSFILFIYLFFQQQNKLFP